MKWSWLVILLFISFWLPVCAQNNGEDDLKRTWYFESPKYEELLSLDSLYFTNGVAKQIKWVYTVFTNLKGKPDRNPTGTTDPSSSLKDFKFPEVTLESADVFGTYAQSLQEKADQETDAALRSDYRQMAIASQETAIAFMETQNSFERNMAVVGLVGSINSMLSGMEALVNHWYQKDMSRSIQWAFGSSSPLYSENAEDPELYLLVVREENSPRDRPFEYRFIFDTKIKYKGEVIALPPYVFTILFYKKKEIEALGSPDGFVPVGNPFNLADFTGLKQNFWTGHVEALILRKIAHDYQKLMAAVRGQ